MARKSASQPNPSEHLTDDSAVPKRSGSKQEQQNKSVATQKRETNHMTDMSIIEYDTDLADAEAPVPLPAGDYPAEIRSAERKTSGAGNEYINVTFVIHPEAYPADYTEGSEDGTILSYGRLNPGQEQRSRWNMKKFCEAIGAPLGKSLDLNSWLGQTAIVTVINEPYEGVDQAKIKKVNPA
jgi:hypothetical protein